MNTAVIGAAKSSFVEAQVLAKALQAWTRSLPYGKGKKKFKDHSKLVPPEMFEKLLVGEGTVSATVWKYVKVFEEVTSFDFRDCLVDWAKSDIQKSKFYYDKVESLKDIGSFIALAARLGQVDASLIARRIFGTARPGDVKAILARKRYPAYETVKRLLIVWMFYNADEDLPQLVELRERKDRVAIDRVTKKTEGKPVRKSKVFKVPRKKVATTNSKSVEKLPKQARVTKPKTVTESPPTELVVKHNTPVLSSQHSRKAMQALERVIHSGLELFELSDIDMTMFDDMDRLKHVTLIKKIMSAFGITPEVLQRLKASDEQTTPGDISDIEGLADFFDGRKI